MDKLRREGIVLDDDLYVAPGSESGQLKIEGQVYLNGDLRMHVEKTLLLWTHGKVQYVQTVRYSYNLVLTGERNIFRYDNSKIKPGHKTDHHKHLYDEAGTEVEVVEVGENWPTLAEVLREAHQAYLRRQAQATDSV